MKILAVGDVCGQGGTETLLKRLPMLKKELQVDFTVVNGENSDNCGEISPTSAEYIFAAGADVITGGNHTLRRKDFRDLIDQNERLLRPHNLPNSEFGSGYCLVDMGYTQVAVINLIGQIYLEKLAPSNPFVAADALIQRAKEDGASVILVDFHAEATSEKRAMGFYLDGRVSAVFGTHTHVQTNDAQILENSTAYMTDLGMTGPLNSVLGIKADIIIDRLKNGGTEKFCYADGICTLEGLLIDVDISTGLAKDIEIIRII